MSILETEFREWQLVGADVQNKANCESSPVAYWCLFGVFPPAARAGVCRVIGYTEKRTSFLKCCVKSMGTLRFFFFVCVENFDLVYRLDTTIFERAIVLLSQVGVKCLWFRSFHYSWRTIWLDNFHVGQVSAWAPKAPRNNKPVSVYYHLYHLFTDRSSLQL